MHKYTHLYGPVRISGRDQSSVYHYYYKECVCYVKSIKVLTEQGVCWNTRVEDATGARLIFNARERESAPFRLARFHSRA